MAEDKDIQPDEELEEENLEEEEELEDDDSNDPYADLSEDELKERLRKAETLIVKKKKKESSKPRRITNQDEDERFERLELQVQGYSPEIVDTIMGLGGKNALKDPIKKKVVDEYVAQAKAERAAEVESSSKSGISKKYSQEELRGMSVEELEKVYKEQGLA